MFLQEAYEWLMQQDYVDNNRLGAVGLCFGGMLSYTLAYLIPQVSFSMLYICFTIDVEIL